MDIGWVVSNSVQCNAALVVIGCARRNWVVVDKCGGDAVGAVVKVAVHRQS